jgi:hypothetical protein
MANITEEHLHHMARRHHAAMQKFDGLRAKISKGAHTFFGIAETGAGAWLGGMLEGRTSGGSIGPVPYNLGIGGVLLAVGHLNLAGTEYSKHFENLGNGFIGSYLAATGYAFGKRWKDSKHVLGGGAGHPWSQPYEESPGAAPPAVHGALTQDQMDAIRQRMEHAAMASVHQ